MFKSVYKVCVSIAGMLILSLVTPARGQDQARDMDRLQRQSVQQFQEGDFRGALAGFNILREIHPANALYSYYAGVCMVELNQDVDDAIELLYGASRRDVPANVHYYLGRAYQRIYNFTEAQDYFNRYKRNATRQELKQLDIDKLINDCRTAREMTSLYYPYEVINVTFIDLYDSVQFTQIRMKGGKLGRKPGNLFSEGEDREALTSLMFLPVNAARGDYAYFSGYHRSGRGGAQLYRVRMGPGRTWVDPEEIRDLNTDGDELLPYFDPIERDLYFASDGRNGVGGLDLYRSHYDQERDEWSEPVNLGFPINSVMDEYLFLPGTDLGMVMFFTNRKATDSTIAVYRVHVSEPRKAVDPEDTELLMEIASLGGVAEEVLADLENHGNAGRAGQGSAVLSSRPASPASGVTGPDRSEYQVVLGGALGHQAASDSLKDLATLARMRVRESDDPNDRWVWQKQIMVWEKKAVDEEEKADLLYAQLGSAGAGQPAGGYGGQRDQAAGTREIPGITKVDTVLGDIVVYRYDSEPVAKSTNLPAPKSTNLPAAKSAILPEEMIAPAPGEMIAPAPGTVRTGNSLQGSGLPVINRFDILEASPYNVSTPIPVDVALPGGTFYRIQLGAFSTPVPPDAFQGISPVTGETVSDRGIIKYYAGKFSRYEDASLALSALRSRGYEDAFIVAWYNGVKLTTGRAKQLEQ